MAEACSQIAFFCLLFSFVWMRRFLQFLLVVSRSSCFLVRRSAFGVFLSSPLWLGKQSGFPTIGSGHSVLGHFLRSASGVFGSLFSAGSRSPFVILRGFALPLCAEPWPQFGLRSSPLWVLLLAELGLASLILSCSLGDSLWRAVRATSQSL